LKQRNVSLTANFYSVLPTIFGPYCSVPYSRRRELRVDFRFLSTYRCCDIFVVKFWPFLDGLRLTVKNVRMLRFIVKFKALVCEGNSFALLFTSSFLCFIASTHVSHFLLFVTLLYHHFFGPAIVCLLLFLSLI